MYKGRAFLNLDDLENGEYEITADIVSDVYKGNVSATFEIKFIRLTILSNDFVTYEHSNATYSVVLLENGTPVSTKPVKFTLNGHTEEVITDSDGRAGISIDLAGGKYEIITCFEGDDLYLAINQTNSIQVQSSLQATVNVTKNYNNVTVDIVLSRNVNVKLFVCVGLKKQVIDAVNGRATLNLNGLANGDYTVEVYQEGNEYDFTNAFYDFSINVTSLRIVCDDFATFENSGELYTVRLVDENDNPVGGKSINFTLNGQSSEVKTDSDGRASLAVNLAGGHYTVTSVFSGDGINMPVSSKNNITVKYSLTAGVNVSKITNNVSVDITLSRDVDIDLNVRVNNENHPVSAVNGKASLNLYNLANGNYTIYITSDDDTVNLTYSPVSFTVQMAKTRIISSDFTTFENSNDNFTVKLVDENNSPVSGVNLKFSLSGKIMEVKIDTEGKASIPIDLKGGNYQITSSFAGSDEYLPFEVSNNVKVKYALDYQINVDQSKDGVQIKVVLSQDISLDMILSLNGQNRSINSKDTLVLYDLENGRYDTEVYLNSDDYVLKPNPTVFYVNMIETRLMGNDLTTYFGSGEKYTVKLLNIENNSLSNQKIKFTVDNNVIEVSTDSNGIASIPVSLDVGEYEITAEFEGNGDYIGCDLSSDITVKSTVTLLNGVFAQNANYPITLLSKNGAPLANRQLSVDIDGNSIQLTTDKNGIADFAISLDIRNHEIKVTNPETSQVQSANITVVARLSENEDIVMYYGAGNAYKVKVFDDRGNPAKGVSVVIGIGNIDNYVITDSEGYATFKITQKPGKYTLTASYKNCIVSNKLTVKTTLITKNIKVKKGKTIKFTAKLLNTQGKILKNKKIKFAFNGKTYKIKTNRKGIAALKIAKKLKAGKYKIKTKYGKLTVSNKITVKK